MRPTRRAPANKRKTAAKFRRNVSRTKAINVIPHRGGYRL